MKNSLKFKIKLVSLIAGTLLTYLLVDSTLLPFIADNDLSNLSSYTGAIATIYTLIIAFIIVEVWSQFNSISTFLASESKALTSIWNYTDYLNDKKIDSKMRKALVEYVKAVTTREKDKAAIGERSKHPSKELVSILRVIDSVKFNDDRDAAVFPNLVDSFESLSSSRSERIDASTNRIPPFLSLLFQVLSVLTLLFFMFVRFESLLVGAFAIAVLSLVISTAYLLVDDMDNPFDGFWNVDYSPLLEAKEYIVKSENK